MKLQSVLALLLGLTLTACTQDLDENAAVDYNAWEGSEKLALSPEGASAGVMAIKVTPEMAEAIESGVTRSESTRSGVESVDVALEQIDASRFNRLFLDPPFETSLREHGLHLWYKVSFPEEVDLMEAARALAKSQAIQTVEFMHRPRLPKFREPVAATIEPGTRATALPMDDELLDRQWHYENDGRGGRRDVADVNLFDAWKICTGNPQIIVAILDGPLDTEHPDLANALWVNTTDADPGLMHGANFCTDEPTPIVSKNDPSQGHGCHVAGTVGAVNGNGQGVCGVAGGKNGQGGVRLMGCQIFSNDPFEDNTEGAADAMIWAANRGALIAQCSFGYDPGTSYSSWYNRYDFEREAIDYFIEYKRTNSPIDGGLVIFAAGNDGNSNWYGTMVGDKKFAPGAYPQVVAVAAAGPDATPGGYTCYGTWVDIFAPGGDTDTFGDEGAVLSVLPHSVSKSGYGWLEGSSMACPHVSGVAALGLSYALELGERFTTAEFRDMLLSSTNSVEEYLTGSKETSGLDYEKVRWVPVTIQLEDYQNKLGGGMVDAYKMLMAVEGTPLMMVGKEQPIEVPLEDLLGGEVKASEFSFTVDPMGAVDRLGLTYEITEDNRLMITCAKSGSSKVKLCCKIGDTSVERYFAVICREQMASNGGWL